MDEDTDGHQVICGQCGQGFPLENGEKHNVHHLIIECPHCGCEILYYAANPPIADSLPVGEIEVPPFVASLTARR